MKTPVFKPERLDPARFARDDGRLAGTRAHADYERLPGLQLAGTVGAADVVSWSAQGQRRQSGARPAEPWLHLQASTTLHLQCQRCLDRLDVPVAVDRHFRFVADEALAAAEDADDDEADVLALGQALDLHGLVEDELILALPLVPRHEDCALPAEPDAAHAGEPAAAAEGGDAPGADEESLTASGRPNPFAALAALRRRPS
jgi:uncharacterized protein